MSIITITMMMRVIIMAIYICENTAVKIAFMMTLQTIFSLYVTSIVQAQCMWTYNSCW